MVFMLNYPLRTVMFATIFGFVLFFGTATAVVSGNLLFKTTRKLLNIYLISMTITKGFFLSRKMCARNHIARCTKQGW